MTRCRNGRGSDSEHPNRIPAAPDVRLAGTGQFVKAIHHGRSSHRGAHPLSDPPPSKGESTTRVTLEGAHRIGQFFHWDDFTPGKVAADGHVP